MSKELTSGQLKRLRAMGRSCPILAQVGKGGITEQVAQRVSDLLRQRELVKVRLLESAGDDRREAAEALASLTVATLVAVVGRTVLLYKPNPELSPDKRVDVEQ